MIEYVSDILMLVFFAGLFSLLVFGPWYFASLRKLIEVVEHVDPEAWAEWGSPASYYELGFVQNRRLVRAIAKQTGINSELKAHPTFRLARRLYLLTTRILATLVVAVFVSALIEKTL